MDLHQLIKPPKSKGSFFCQTKYCGFKHTKHNLGIPFWRYLYSAGNTTFSRYRCLCFMDLHQLIKPPKSKGSFFCQTKYCEFKHTKHNLGIPFWRYLYSAGKTTFSRYQCLCFMNLHQLKKPPKSKGSFFCQTKYCEFKHTKHNLGIPFWRYLYIAGNTTFSRYRCLCFMDLHQLIKPPKSKGSFFCQTKYCEFKHTKHNLGIPFWRYLYSAGKTTFSRYQCLCFMNLHQLKKPPKSKGSFFCQTKYCEFKHTKHNLGIPFWRYLYSAGNTTFSRYQCLCFMNLHQLIKPPKSVNSNIVKHNLDIPF